MNRDPTRPELSDDERMLLGYLHRYCRGAGRARTYARLRADMAEIGVPIGEREMYGLVGALVLKGRPVATTPAGAYVWQSARDVRAGLRHLVGRVVKQHRRIKAYKATAREGLSGQAYLDLADAERAYVQARKAAGGALVAQADLFAVEGRT